jgi:glyoxylase-like metal-dependent hydrolase (beta-lactamase superfamily II)
VAFAVNARCIDCDTCRTLAPDVFGDGDGQAVVTAQPEGAAARARAARALVACPTAAIVAAPRPPELAAAARAFPMPVDGLKDVYTCGYASPASYGASSWLLRRAAGNVLVDSPRAVKPLLDNLEALGGVALMFLTHRDDVADHARFRRRLGCERILHADDVGPGTRDVERQPRGGEPVRLAEDLVMIPVPGHTRGSAALLWRQEVLFTGDHLWWSPELARLDASRAVCWWSWAEQRRSLLRLREHPFRAVLPGHGRPLVLPDAAAMRRELDRVIAAVG